MKQKLIHSIQHRVDTELAPQNPVKFLKELPADECIELAIGIVYLYTRAPKGAQQKIVLMTEVISAIGHAVRNKFKLKRDSALAAKSGAFILYSFELLELTRVSMGKGSNGHATYIIEVLADDKLSQLWETVGVERTEKLPSLSVYADWTSTKHATGVAMVKTADQDVLRKITPETHPIVFNVLNKSQHVGWSINSDIYIIYSWALRNKTEAFADIWEMQNPEAKQSKIREAKAIGSIAKRFLGEVFYHLYTYDFRGRKYVSTAYLHEQGTDLAKGLLLRADKKAIGEQGFFWLCISIASNWAGDAGRDDGAKTDKIPLEERVYWVLDNEEIILSYAAAPKVNQGWMKAEKPWQFLAACNELKKIRDWVATPQPVYTDSTCLPGGVLIPPERSVYDYESHLECFIDGSNNGSQHLSALTRDEITAPHVNLVPSDLPGDLYKYVADHVWLKVLDDVAKLTHAEVKRCEALIDTIADLKMQLATVPAKSERRKEIIAELIEYKHENADLVKAAAPVFWARVRDNKQRRKVTKRGVMTLPLN
jgi:hypothetical protein